MKRERAGNHEDRLVHRAPRLARVRFCSGVWRPSDGCRIRRDQQACEPRTPMRHLLGPLLRYSDILYPTSSVLLMLSFRIFSKYAAA